MVHGAGVGTDLQTSGTIRSDRFFFFSRVLTAAPSPPCMPTVAPSLHAYCCPIPACLLLPHPCMPTVAPFLQAEVVLYSLQVQGPWFFARKKSRLLEDSVVVFRLHFYIGDLKSVVIGVVVGFLSVLGQLKVVRVIVHINRK